MNDFGIYVFSLGSFLISVFMLISIVLEKTVNWELSGKLILPIMVLSFLISNFGIYASKKQNIYKIILFFVFFILAFFQLLFWGIIAFSSSGLNGTQ